MTNYTLYRDGDEIDFFPAASDADAVADARRIWATEPGNYEVYESGEFVGSFTV